MRRLGLRGIGGSKPQWKFTEERGAIARKKGKGGIDWWRYQKHIVKPLLIPSAQDCQKERPGTIAQEDKAPSHNSKYQVPIFNAAAVQRLLWPGNSPDCNQIESCWPWMKRRTTRKGAPQNRLTAVSLWEKAWEDCPDEKRKGWIERMPRHIQKTIELDGGNGYKEGRTE